MPKIYTGSAPFVSNVSLDVLIVCKIYKSAKGNGNSVDIACDQHGEVLSTPSYISQSYSETESVVNYQLYVNYSSSTLLGWQIAYIFYTQKYRTSPPYDHCLPRSAE
jgi:hypothetical protein